MTNFSKTHKLKYFQKPTNEKDGEEFVDQDGIRSTRVVEEGGDEVLADGDGKGRHGSRLQQQTPAPGEDESHGTSVSLCKEGVVTSGFFHYRRHLRVTQGRCDTCMFCFKLNMSIFV